MSLDYPAIAAEVLEVLAEVGGPCTLIRAQRADYDPGSSSADAGREQRYDGVAVRTEYSLRDREGGLIEDTDCKLYVAALGSAGGSFPQPATTDVILFAGVRYTVMHCKPISPAGTAVVYEVQARAA